MLETPSRSEWSGLGALRASCLPLTWVNLWDHPLPIARRRPSVAGLSPFGTKAGAPHPGLSPHLWDAEVVMRNSLVLILDPIDELVEYARLAERTGFHAVWVTDFFNRDAFVRMAAIGAGTQRIGVASGIAYAFARSPVLTAAAAADVDEITGGRVTLGLGTGTRRMQESWYGLRFESPAAKAAEVVRLLRALWSAPAGQPFRFEGHFYRIAIDHFGRPGCVRSRIPVYLG